MPSKALKVEPAPVSGNGAVTEVRCENDIWIVEFMSEPRTSPQPLWFHLQCECAGERKVRFAWLNADSCLGLGQREQLEAVRPVVRLDRGPWQRVKRVRVKQRPLGGHFLTFETPAACSRAAAAFCYPYGPDDLEETLAGVADAWAQQAIGLSRKGRPLLRLHAGRVRRPKPGPGAYVLARQHAGETPGSWVLDGLLREVSQAGAAEPLRQVEWWVVPFVDLDGAVEGNYGKDALPWDFNRAWSEMPMRPEVLSIQRDMRRFAERAEPRLVLDLHAPGGGENRFYQFLCRDDRPRLHKLASLSFAAHLAAEFPDVPQDSLALVPRYASRWTTGHTATTWPWDSLDRTLGVCLETTYQAIGDGPWLGPDDYRDIGRRVARAVTAWLMRRQCSQGAAPQDPQAEQPSPTP